MFFWFIFLAQTNHSEKSIFGFVLTLSKDYRNIFFYHLTNFGQALVELTLHLNPINMLLADLWPLISASVSALLSWNDTSIECQNV